MAKKSRKRPARLEKHQSGCMWGLINIFDNRHGISSQKLLPDRKHVDKNHIVGAQYPDVLDSLSDSSEVDKKPNVSETPTIVSTKMSVKELMEEDMISPEKSHGRTRSKIDLDIDDSVPAEDINSDVNVMVEEICTRIHQDCELDPCFIEEKLCEATKVLVDHFIGRKSFDKDEKIESSSELVGALRILNSNKGMFLKLLKDSNSLLAKHIQCLPDIQAEEGKFEVLTESELLEENSGNGKLYNFFWRRFKGLERNSSKKSECSEDLNRIVVLKPCFKALSECQIERVSSSSFFSFTELKRKLKNAMRKEPQKKTGRETALLASPKRDHFFIERIPKFSDKTEKLKDGKIKLEYEAAVSNIYIEAKKHIAEIVGSSDADYDTQVPKALGKILTFSGYCSPTICSPRTDGGLRLCQTESDKPVHGTVLDPRVSLESPCESSVDNLTQEAEICAFKVDSLKERHLTEISSECSEEKCLLTSLEQEICDETGISPTTPIESTPSCSASENIKDVDIISDATSKPSPVSVLEPVFKDDEISHPDVNSFTVSESFQPRQIHFEVEILSSTEQFFFNRKHNIENEKYTFEFVKAVVQMSGLTWDALLRRFLFSDHVIDPELIDEVDFLPDLLPCDFNLLFHLISEVLIQICQLNFGCTLSFANPFVNPESKGKDIFTEIWKVVDWYLKLDGGPRLTLDQILGNDFAKPEMWMDLQLDREGIGIQVQEAVLEELVEELVQEIEEVNS